jgi:anti-sigma regulatory factor (Ser/Thr protein kinase)
MATLTTGESLGYRHEAVFYDGFDHFVDVAVRFVLEGCEADEQILVATSGAKIAALQGELGDHAGRVEFADMSDLGRNPGRIIPRWQRFIDEGASTGVAMRGIGEPIWPERTAEELVECHRHEALLNVAFPESVPFWLVCPYDTSRLAPDVLAAAHGTHPVTSGDGVYAGVGPMNFDMGEPLMPAPPGHLDIPFDGARLPEIRRIVGSAGEARGLPPQRVSDLVLAVNELAANSVLHGGGHGTLRVWSDDDGLVTEVIDDGHIDDPMTGRIAPSPDAATGRGLWIVNQVCDLVQLRSDDSHTVVRLFMRAH